LGVQRQSSSGVFPFAQDDFDEIGHLTATANPARRVGAGSKLTAQDSDVVERVATKQRRGPTVENKLFL
jgi:hypothetical protein